MRRRITALDGVAALLIVLLMVQIWLNWRFVHLTESSPHRTTLPNGDMTTLDSDIGHLSLEGAMFLCQPLLKCLRGAALRISTPS